MVGYSGTPLLKKLGIKEGAKIYVKNLPIDYEALVGELPERAVLKNRLDGGLDFVHIFTKPKKELINFLGKAKQAIKPDGMIWVSWPKKSANVATDLTENIVCDIALPMDLVDIKVSAIDETWSGLKLVIRKIKRQ